MAERPRDLRLAVLVSGSGTNLQAILDRCAAGLLPARVVVVAADRPDAYGLVRAHQMGVPTHVVDYRRYLSGAMDFMISVELESEVKELDARQRILGEKNREKRLRKLARLVLAEKEMIRALEAHEPDYICLAGFMRLVTPYFLAHFHKSRPWRVINIHPALLPAFPGRHGYEDTFGYGCKWGGVTVHFVDEGEDTGPILAQAVYPIWPGDDLEAVRGRGLHLEYQVYSQCIQWLWAGHVEVRRREDGGRWIALIHDPSYPDILRAWVNQAMAPADL
ncbi:MAG: phosphoribosylglycinamide formyltransferase [Syntrophobacteraceae bacterium]|nr:phosphoribosylglycinamide formyltransferase [Syntrophobacteraceae bacterium]